MLQKAADELGSVQADGSQAVAFGFAIAQEHPPVLDLDDSAVADGHFKHIGGKILQTGRRAPHGLAVDHPVCLPDIGRDQIIQPGSGDLIAELGGIDFRHGLGNMGLLLTHHLCFDTRFICLGLFAYNIQRPGITS
jgi:hypothetical protein